MKPSLKTTLMTVTMLSAGFFAFSSDLAYAAYKKPKVKKAASNISFKQYPKLGEVKDDVNIALDLHQTATSLLSEKQQLEEYKASIEKYNEIERRLKQNVQCNVSQLKEHFSDGDTVWKKVSAWAEDSASTLLAEASDSLGDAESSSQLSALEAKMNAGDTSEDTSAASTEESQYSSINENTSTEEAMKMVEADSDAAEKELDDAQNSDMDLGDAAKFGKVRWDVGYRVLEDVYANPKKWGNLKKKFTPWLDQQHVYDQYLNEFYDELEEQYSNKFFRTNDLGIKIPYTKAFPVRPKAVSYMPEDNYTGEVPDVTVSSVKYNASKASADDKWCGSTNGMKNVCTRVNSGPLYVAHMAYVAALQSGGFKKVGTPKLDAPYLPQKPLPPWRESVYIMNVEKELPEMASDLPDPWFKVTQSIKNFRSGGELSNLVEKHKNKTIRFYPDRYNHETGEIKIGSDGQPRLPLPLMENRISSYLSLISAKEEQEPIKDRAIASIKEMNENILSTMEKAGYTVPNRDAFDLANEADYNMAVRKMKELQNAKIASAKAKMANLQASFGGKLLPSVTKILQEETVTMDALQKDSEFLIGVTRDNAKEINSLLLTAAADATANQTYKENLESSMEESTPIPSVGCPVL